MMFFVSRVCLQVEMDGIRYQNENPTHFNLRRDCPSECTCSTNGDL